MLLVVYLHSIFSTLVTLQVCTYCNASIVNETFMCSFMWPHFGVWYKNVYSGSFMSILERGYEVVSLHAIYSTALLPQVRT